MMDTLYKKFGTNQDKEKEGAWIYYDDELAFKVKRISGRNKKFMLASEKIEKLKRRGELSKAEEDKKLAGLFVDCSLVDWKGVTDKEGKEIPFSKNAAIELLTNPDWPDFFPDLFLKAHDNEHFKDLEKESGN
jgi:hypothetical protein